MSFGSSPGDPVDDRDQVCHDLLGSLTVISANVQLLRRRVLRADGLAILERERLLGTIARTMTALEQHQHHLDRVLSDPPVTRNDDPADPNSST